VITEPRGGNSALGTATDESEAETQTSGTDQTGCEGNGREK